jgi:hypothetical protein
MTFLNSVDAFTSWVLRVPSNLSALRSHRWSGTSASSDFLAIAKRLASGTTSLLAGEPGRPRLVTPGILVFVNGLGLGCSDDILDIRLEVDCDSNFSGARCNSEPEIDVAETTIPSEGEYARKTDGYDGELDSDAAEGKTDGYDGELDSDVADTSIPSYGYDGEPDIGKTDGYDGELDSDAAEGKTDRYDGEIDSDVADTSIPSDGYDGEPDIGKTDGYDDELESDVAEGRTDAYDGELDSDVAETSIPSDGYDGEPDIDVADMTICLEVESDDSCLVLTVSNMTTFFVEGSFSNGELPPVKLRPLRGTRILSNMRRTPAGVKLGNDAHTWVMTSGAKVA